LLPLSFPPLGLAFTGLDIHPWASTISG
jgi:hypothetical protein